MQIYDYKKKYIDATLFTLKINNLNIEHADCIWYFRVLLDDKLSWLFKYKNYTKSF